MKRLFNTGNYKTTFHFWLLLLRVVVACAMLTHGLPKLQNLLSGHIQFADPLHIGVKTSLVLTVFAEVICSGLIFIGLATRFAIMPLLINMSVALFVVHAQADFAKKELSILYLAIYITLEILGPGKFSVDGAIGGKSGRR